MFFPRMRLRCRFETVQVGDKLMAVGICSDTYSYNGVIELQNDSARFMFEKLQEGISVPELIKACTEKYTDSPVEEVGPKVLAFLDELREQGLLEADSRHGMIIGD